MVALERLTLLRRAARNIALVLVASGGFVAIGHFLRQLNIVLSPLAWSNAEIILALLSFTIAANVLVRYHGTGHRVSLLLGLTFAVTGIVHLGAIVAFFRDLFGRSTQFHVPFSWMAGQTLLGTLLLIASAV